MSNTKTKTTTTNNSTAEKQNGGMNKNGHEPVSNSNTPPINSNADDDADIGEYEPKISARENYHAYLQLVHSPSLSDEDGSPTKVTQSGIEEMVWDEHGQMYTESLNSPTHGGGLPSDESHLSSDPEERERQMEELKEELNKVESEIVTLRQVLTTKVREAAEIKRKMGITPFQEFKHDMKTGINQIKGSNTYQKTSAVVKTASEKTSSAISTIGTSMSRKLGDIRNSQTFRSMEERVGSTYASVKAKVGGSRSDEQLDATQEDGVVAGQEATTAFTSGQEASTTFTSGGKLPEEKVPL